MTLEPWHLLVYGLVNAVLFVYLIASFHGFKAQVDRRITKLHEWVGRKADENHVSYRYENTRTRFEANEAETSHLHKKVDLIAEHLNVELNEEPAQMKLVKKPTNRRRAK